MRSGVDDAKGVPCVREEARSDSIDAHPQSTAASVRERDIGAVRSFAGNVAVGLGDADARRAGVDDRRGDERIGRGACARDS